MNDYKLRSNRAMEILYGYGDKPDIAELCKLARIALEMIMNKQEVTEYPVTGQADYFAKKLAVVIDDCRAAMLQRIAGTETHISNLQANHPVVYGDGFYDGYWKARGEHPEHDASPFMYGIRCPDGSPYFDEFCVSASEADIQDAVNCLNEGAEDGLYEVVALYTFVPV
jgi:hypothetical protein